MQRRENPGAQTLARTQTEGGRLHVRADLVNSVLRGIAATGVVFERYIVARASMAGGLPRRCCPFHEDGSNAAES